MRTTVVLLLLSGLNACTAPVDYPGYAADYPGYAANAQPYAQPYSQTYPQPYAAPYAQSPPPPSDQPGKFALAMLRGHNAVRAEVDVPPLGWSPRLAAVAQNWADTLLRTGRFAHQTGNRYGENLFEISGATASPEQVVEAWADEARDYDIRNNSCAGECGHYTQIVWRATRLVGCAAAAAEDREIDVCEYDPPGNVIGFSPY